jgi:3-oxoacyl-(acyl-carrier-protein) synthase
MNVFVTGFGIISAIGNNVSENLTSLIDNKSGIEKAKFFESKFVDNLCFGEVKLSIDQLCKLTNRSISDGYTKTDLFAFKAFDEAIQMAKLSLEDLSSIHTALISSSTVGGMAETDDLYNDANLLSEASIHLHSYGSGVHTVRLAREFGIIGFTDTLNTACSSSANAIMLGAKLIKAGKAKRVIVGGSDSLSKFTVNGFNSLQILSKCICSPLSSDRDGLNLGEGAGYLVLESSEVVGEKKIFAEIKGYGNSNDAYHPTALSGEAKGVTLAMEQAINSANLTPQDIDYVNTHGTATHNNDEVELNGLKKLFGKITFYNSTKSYTGHTLAAAGVLEAIYSILSINNKFLIKSLNCDNPIFKENPPLNENIYNFPVNHVLSNSFGFGGNCTSLIISKVG